MPALAAGLFHDIGAWRQLDSRIIEPLVAAHDESVPIRAWAPGCGNGEDACALAILLQERIEARDSRMSFQLFATENPPKLERARDTLFPETALQAVSLDRRRRWFEQTGDRWRLKHSPRSRMVFARHDLVNDPGLSDMHLVVCLGLDLLRRDEQMLALAHLLSALRTRGALFVGGLGTMAPDAFGLEPIDAEAGLYVKVADAALHAASAPAAADIFRLRKPEDLLEELEASREKHNALNRELCDAQTRLSEVVRDREARIRQLETQRAMLAGGPVVALFLDHALRIQWYTPAAADLFTIGESDLNRALSDVAPRFDDPGFFPALDTALKTGRVEEAEMRASSGRFYARTVRCYEADRAGRRGLAITFADITARKQAEDARRENAERLRLALAVGELATWDWNMRTGDVVWSDEHFAMHGYADGEVEPSCEAWLARVHPEDRAAAEAALTEARDRRTGYDHDFRSVHPNGSVRWLSAKGSYFYDQTGAPCRMFGVMRDITAQKRAREQLLLLNTELERRVREEVDAREKATAQLAQAEKLAALGELAGGVAHDFNNALQAITTSAEVIRRRPDDVETVRRAVNLQVKAAERGASVARRLLAFAHRAELHSQQVDIAALLPGLRELLVSALGAAVRIHVEAEDGLPEACADRGQFETVLVNLANNARDAMEDGGDLTLSARRETVARAHDGLVVGDYLRLDIADTGVGMDRTTLARAAEPFFTTKPVGKGTGLGLSMARGFAEQFGGALSVASEPGRGTVVTLWLPTAPPPKQAQGAADGRPGTRR